ncbi:hypothetical protein AALP_AA1G225200 [Arabis alpina]|uniref:Uncharacterized protein n=1 Tax=Arabis alpina TaxID=50452 RepID=A0A087HPX9_ARAAL|nr:hypothetical protein AALP_AA1G225200 [Arabis alpina]
MDYWKSKVVPKVKKLFEKKKAPVEEVFKTEEPTKVEETKPVEVTTGKNEIEIVDEKKEEVTPALVLVPAATEEKKPAVEEEKKAAVKEKKPTVEEKKKPVKEVKPKKGLSSYFQGLQFFSTKPTKVEETKPVEVTTGSKEIEIVEGEKEEITMAPVPTATEEKKPAVEEEKKAAAEEKKSTVEEKKPVEEVKPKKGLSFYLHELQFFFTSKKKVNAYEK